MSYQIITDCTCDLAKNIYEYYPIIILPMEVNLDGEVFLHTHDFKNIGVNEFYTRLKEGSVSSTSQINPEIFKLEFEKALKDDKDVLYIGFSSGLSGTYQSSRIAKRELEELYPNRKIIVCDSLAASAGQGLLVYHALLNQEKGMSIEENSVWLETNKLNLAHWVTVDDLQFLKRGGRISSTVALVGTALKIKPIIHVDNEGHLVNVSKARGRKAAFDVLIQQMIDTGKDIANQTIFISHADAKEDVDDLVSRIHEKTLAQNIVISNIGPVIGSHSGPGTIALFFLATKR